MVNPLLAALGAETVTEPIFKPLHNPEGFIVNVKDAGVVADVCAPTVIQGVDVEAVTGVAELSLAKSVTPCISAAGPACAGLYWKKTFPGLASTTALAVTTKVTGMLMVPVAEVIVIVPA
jgi:hypothetical protein